MSSQIFELAGCDYLTISPKLLEELAQAPASAISPKLDKAHPKQVRDKWAIDQKEFQFALTMVCNKLRRHLI